MAQQNEQWIIKIERNLRESEEKFSQPTKQHGNCIGVIPGAHGLERYTHTHTASISLDRFIDSCHLLLHWYQQRNTQHATTFTVAHSESLPDDRVHRGSHKHTSHTTTARLR